MKFTNTDSQTLDENEKLVAKASRVGALYYLNCLSSHQQTCAAKAEGQNTNLKGTCGINVMITYGRNKRPTAVGKRKAG